MKLAMAQMSMTGSMDENLKRSLAFCDAAAGSDLLFFPEVQLIVQELDLAEARLWREQKRPYLRQRRPECYLKKERSRVGSPAQGSFLIYIPGTGSGACPDSYARTRWRTPGSRRCRPCSACTRRSSAGGAQRCRCR